MSSEQTPLPIQRQTSNSPAKPVPDVEAFQRVLAAVYTLQQYHDRLAKSSVKSVPEATSQGDDKRIHFIHSVSSFPKTTEPQSVTDVENDVTDVESEQELDQAQPVQHAQLITWPAPADVTIFPELGRPQSSRRATQIAVFAVIVLFLVFGALLMSHRQAKSGVAAHAGSDVNQNLASAVSARIHGERRLQSMPLQISASKGGIITLSGEVGSAADRVLAAQQASKVQGVRVVIDNLRIQD